MKPDPADLATRFLAALRLNGPGWAEAADIASIVWDGRAPKDARERLAAVAGDAQDALGEDGATVMVRRGGTEYRLRERNAEW